MRSDLVWRRGQQAADAAREIEDNLIAPCCWSQPVSHARFRNRGTDPERSEQHGGRGQEPRRNLWTFMSPDTGKGSWSPRAPKGSMCSSTCCRGLAATGRMDAGPVAEKIAIAGSGPGTEPLPDPRYTSVVEKEMKELEE